MLLIILLAAVLRFWQLGVNPPALSWDEAAWGYNAYSLGQTGRDEFGELLPFSYLESFGDFKPPVYAYLAILPVKIFGLNEFATRFPSAFLGTLTVLLTYFLVKELFKKKESLALVASFLLAISPWHIMLSRAAFEANVASFLIIAGVSFFLAGIRKKSWLLLLSAVSFALSLQTFNTARVVVPLLVLGMAIGFYKELWLKKKWIIAAGLISFLILLPSVSFFLSSRASLRFKEVNIFSDPWVVIQSNQEIENDSGAWWSSLIHNRRWGYGLSFLTHYFDHFNPSFLFIKGDGNPKFSTQDVGELYLWEMVFLISGVLLLLRKKQGHWWLIPFWLLVGIIPAATARETPHALRIETTLPTWQILTALGLVGFWDWTSQRKNIFKNVFRLGFCGLVLMSLVFFQHGYYRHYPTEFSGEWQYGYRESIEFISSVEDEYDQIWFTDKIGRPYIYFLFHLKKDPKEFWDQAVVERETLGFVKVRSFGKYFFFENDFKLDPAKRVLVVNLADWAPTEVEVIKTFNLLNGEPILKAYSLGAHEEN